jgi:hypothetical protein
MLNKTRPVQIVRGVVANVALVAGYASFVKHSIPSAGLVLLVVAIVVASSEAAVCSPGRQTRGRDRKVLDAGELIIHFGSWCGWTSRTDASCPSVCVVGRRRQDER